MTLAGLVALTLAACTGASTGGGPAPAPDDSATMTQAGDDTTTEPTPEATETTAPTDAVALPECEGILFETGAEIGGQLLADCMSAAMFAAGSGSHIVESSDGSPASHVDFEWTPQFSMYAQGEATYVVTGDEGWVQMDGRWVRGDQTSSDPEEVIAGAVVELVRTFGDPRVMTSAFTQTVWDVVEEGPVPTTGAVSDTAWLLEPQGTFEMLGVTVTGAQLWLGTDYLGVYYVATGSFSGISATSSNTFTQWGEPVEIPDVGA